MQTVVDFNADAGESFGRWRLGDDENLIPLVSSVNVACGWHAGDAATMRRSVRTAQASGVAVGAHPGFPDLTGFGRRALAMSPHEAADACLYQYGALRAIADRAGVPVRHVKPHGGLYGLSIRDEQVARAIAEAMRAAAPDVPVVMLAGAMADRFAAEGFPVVREAFADLDYDDSGTIIIDPASEAKDPQRCADQAEAALRGEITSVHGRAVAVDADTVCVHGDRPNSVEIARAVRNRFGGIGVRIAPMSEVVAQR